MGCYMIAYKKIELEKAAKQAGFVRDTFEKSATFERSVEIY